MLTDPMSGQATDPMASKPKTTPLQPPQTAQTNPIPQTGGTASAASPMTPPKALDATPSTPLGARDPLAFAQTPAPAPAASTASTAAPTLGPSGMSNDFLTSRVYGGDTDPYINQEFGKLVAAGQATAPVGWTAPTGPAITNLAPTSGQAFTLGPGGQYATVQRNGVWQNADGSPLAPGTDQFGASTFTGTGMQPSSTAGVTNPSAGQPIAPASAASAPRAADATPSIPTTGGLPGTVAGLASGAPFSTSPTTPGQDLRSETITANSGLDRVGLAQKLIDNLRAQSEPAYQAEQRALTQNAAANGQTGSGMFRTSLGDAARQHELDLQNGSLGFLSDALKGSVADNQFATNVAQQQQGFQEGQQRSAFDQQVQQQQLQEALKNGDFSRALSMLTAGNAGNPGDTAMMLSQIFGNQATGANAALGSAITGRQANQANQSQNDLYAQILRQIYGGGGVQQSGTPAPETPTTPSISDIYGGGYY